VKREEKIFFIDVKHIILLFIIGYLVYERINSQKLEINNPTEKIIIERRNIKMEKETINIEKEEKQTKNSMIHTWPYPKSIQVLQTIRNITNWKDFKFEQVSQPDTIVEKAFERYKRYTFYNKRIPSNSCFKKACLKGLRVTISKKSKNLVPPEVMDEEYSFLVDGDSEWINIRANTRYGAV
jgi:hypothetical protein